MVAIDFRSWKITLNPVEHHSEPDGAALSLLRSKEATWRFALDMRVQANDLECRIDYCVSDGKVYGAWARRELALKGELAEQRRRMNVPPPEPSPI